MRNNKLLKILWIFVISFLLQFLFLWLRGGYITVMGLSGIPMSMLVFAIVYFIATVLLLKKYRNFFPAWIIATVILVGMSLPDLYLRFLKYDGFRRTLISLPDFIIRILAVAGGYWYYKISTKTGKTVFIIVSALFVLWSSCFGFDLWNRSVVGNEIYPGKVEKKAYPLVLQDRENRRIPVENFTGQYLILAFWTTGCDFCMSELPKIQRWNDELKATEQIKLYSVFCPKTTKGETPQTGIDILNEKGCTFPVFFIETNDPILKEIGATGFPTVVIFAPDGKLVYSIRGSVEAAKGFIETNQ